MTGFAPLLWSLCCCNHWKLSDDATSHEKYVFHPPLAHHLQLAASGNRALLHHLCDNYSLLLWMNPQPINWQVVHSTSVVNIWGAHWRQHHHQLCAASSIATVASGEKAIRTHKMPRLIGQPSVFIKIICVRTAIFPKATINSSSSNIMPAVHIVDQ
jgi:hypothetical protein